MLRNVSTQLGPLRNILTSHVVAHKRMIIMICAIFAVSFAITYKLNFYFNTLSYSKSLSQTISELGINEALHFSRLSNNSVSLESDTDCNLNKKGSCYTTNKSLVVTFWRESSRDKWLAKNMLKVFPEKNFVRIIMVHDSSIWSSYPNKELFIWIYVHSQKRFWYIKRFLTPTVMKAYKYIWIVDDDMQLLFEPLHYECVLTQLNISLSSPGRLEGIASHQITLVDKNFVDKIGRWTDFVEIGPIVVGSSLAWQCMWHFLSPFVGLGWGLDLIWCRLLAHNCGTNATMYKTCAVLDVFKVNHLTNYIGSTAVGSQERPAYDEYYNNFHTQQINFNPLANDLAVYSSCIKS